jgi:hypothetical protein
MKFLLTPLTAAAFFMLSSASIYGLVLLTAYLYSLSWFWLVIVYLFTGAIAFATLKTWLMIGVSVVMHFYDYRLFSRIIDAVGLSSGIIFVVAFFLVNPPYLSGANGNEFLLTGMWEAAWFKTIFVLIPVASAVFFLVALNIETLRFKPVDC